MRQIILGAVITMLLSFPLTASAQKVKSANYNQTNGSDHYSTNQGAAYDVTRDRQAVNTIRHNANVKSSAIAKEIEKKAKDAEQKAKNEAAAKQREEIWKKENEKKQQNISN